MYFDAIKYLGIILPNATILARIIVTCSMPSPKHHGCIVKLTLYLLLLECGYLVGEPLRVLGSFVVGELLLHVGHYLVLQLETQSTFFLQLPPLIVHFSLVGTGFLEQ